MKLKLPNVKIDWQDQAENLLEWVVPDVGQCHRMARELRDRHPRRTPEQLANKAVASAQKWGAAAGAITGTASTPLTGAPNNPGDG